MTIAIEMENLTKAYDSFVALNNVTIHCQKNKIYGLLGTNGAGKTTLMHLIAGQTIPTSGSIRVFGQSVYENTDALRQICFTPPLDATNNYAKTFKVKDFLITASMFYPNWDQKFAKELIELFSLDLKKTYSTLSTGMRSMVSIIISLASRAPVTLLDEPYSGLDASARQRFYDVLADDYSRYPRTILFSTHLIDEASRLFEDIIVLEDGEVLLCEPLEEVEQRSFLVTGDKDIIESMVARKKIIHREILGHRGSYALFDTVTEQEKSVWTRAGLELHNLSLQQLFIYLTTKPRRS